MSGLVEVRSYKKSQAWFSKQLAVMRRSVQKSESAWLQSWSREEKREKRKVYLEKQRSYARAVQRAKRVYELRQRMKLEENAGSNGFWKSVRSIGLSNKGRSMANLVEVYDNQGEVKTGYDAVEVWRSYIYLHLCWVVKLNKVILTMEMNLMFCGQQVAVEKTFNLNWVVGWIFLYFRRKWI